MVAEGTTSNGLLLPSDVYMWLFWPWLVVANMFHVTGFVTCLYYKEDLYWNSIWQPFVSVARIMFDYKCECVYLYYHLKVKKKHSSNSYSFVTILGYYQESIFLMTEEFSNLVLHQKLTLKMWNNSIFLKVRVVIELCFRVWCISEVK